jgi:uncharacterized protein
VKRIFLALVLLIVGASACGSVESEATDPPIPVIADHEEGWHDATGTVDGDTLARLRAESRHIHETGVANGKGHQVAGVFVKSIASELSQYAADVGNKNGIGSKEKDNGVLILVVLEREASDGNKPSIFVATGRGAEGDLPDSKVTDLREEFFNPKRADGQWQQGLVDLTRELGKVLIGEDEASSKSSGDEISGAAVLGLVVVGVVVILLVLFFFLGGRSSSGGGYSSRPRYTATDYTPPSSGTYPSRRTSSDDSSSTTRRSSSRRSSRRSSDDGGTFGGGWSSGGGSSGGSSGGFSGGGGDFGGGGSGD